MNASDFARAVAEDEWEYETTIMIDVVVRGKTPRGQPFAPTDIEQIVTRHPDANGWPLPSDKQTKLQIEALSPNEIECLRSDINEMLEKHWRDEDVDATTGAFFYGDDDNE